MNNAPYVVVNVTPLQMELWRRAEEQAVASDKCPPCPKEPQTSCNCKKGQQCTFIQRSCYECSRMECIGQPSSSVNPGVIAGPIIGAFLVIASGCLFWWLRRKKKRDLARLEDLAERARKGESSAFHLSNASSPVNSRHHSTQGGAGGLKSPTNSRGSRGSSGRLPHAPVEAQYRDAEGNMVRVYAGKRGAINADPNHPDNGGVGDPFGDHASMSTENAESGHSTNVVPIQYVPGQSNDGHAVRNGQPANQQQQQSAARTLDQARQNLWRPRPAQPPPRPARAPDLDLRLTSLQQQLEHQQMMTEIGSSRDSFRSGTSVAPSFMSGATADLHLDVPKIMTRQQVNVGKLQAAEMVHFGTAQTVNLASSATPTDDSHASGGSDPFASEHSAEMLNQGQPNAPYSSNAAAASSASLESRRFDDEGNMSQPSPTDLRFSMGSLAYDRTSVSTQGTGHRATRDLLNQNPNQPPVPSLPAGYGRQRLASMASYRSTGNDSLLGSFPMIPPSGGANSSSTDLPLVQPGAVRPPTAFKGTGAGAGSAPGGRPLTATSAHSLADSFLGRFPFVPPNVDTDGSQRSNGPSRMTLGMSNVSGLGGFEFNFDGPPAPTATGVAAPTQQATAPAPAPAQPVSAADPADPNTATAPAPEAKS